MGSTRKTHRTRHRIGREKGPVAMWHDGGAQAVEVEEAQSAEAAELREVVASLAGCHEVDEDLP